MSQDDPRYYYAQQYAQPSYGVQQPYYYQQNSYQQYYGYGQQAYHQNYPQQYQMQYPPKKTPFKSRVTEEDVTDPAPTLEELQTLIPSLHEVNRQTFDPTLCQQAYFVIIRSATIDNVHKGMKNGVWTSTSRSNQKLHNLFLQAQSHKQEVYLLYTVVGSQAFQGVARLASPFDVKFSFPYWDEPHKWFGTFQVQWIYVNEIPQAYLESQVSNFKVQHSAWTDQGDCTQIPAEQGVFIMRCFKQRLEVPENRMIARFPYLNKREEEIRANRDSDPEFQAEQAAQDEIFQRNPFEYKQHKQKRHRNLVQQYYPQQQDYYGYMYHQEHQSHHHQPQQQQYEESDTKQPIEDRFAVKQRQQRKPLVSKQKKKLSKTSNPIDYQQDPMWQNAIIPQNAEADSDEQQE